MNEMLFFGTDVKRNLANNRLVKVLGLLTVTEQIISLKYTKERKNKCIWKIPILQN